MADISNVRVIPYEAEGAKGIIIAPPHEEKKVVIPSPPSTQIIPTTYQGAIYLTNTVYTADSDLTTLKEYVAENKFILICPAVRELDGLMAASLYAINSGKEFDLKRNSLSIRTDAASCELGSDLADKLSDEEDIEVETDELEL